MGILTAQDLVTRTRSAIGNIQSEQYPDDYILASLNYHQLRLVVSYPWTDYGGTETITTTSGTAAYALSATSVLAIENVVNLTGGRYDLKRMDDVDYDIWGRELATGKPLYWMSEAPTSQSSPTDTRRVLLWPTPNAAYQFLVRYAKRPTDLVLTPAANYSILPSLFDEVLIAYAVSDAWTHLNEFEKAGGHAKLAQSKENMAVMAALKLTEVSAPSGQSWRAGVRGW